MSKTPVNPEIKDEELTVQAEAEVEAVQDT